MCRHWRGIALSTPALWSSLNLLLPEGMPYEPTTLKRVSMMVWKIAKTIVSRSSDTLLIITDPLLPYTDFPDKLRRIGATPDRWEKLTASGHTMVAILLDSLEAQVDLPNLRSLKLLGGAIRT